MFIAQEIHYLAKGRYQHLKRLLVVHEVSQGGVYLRGAFQEGANFNAQGMPHLPSMEVTPKQYKEVIDRATRLGVLNTLKQG